MSRLEKVLSYPSIMVHLKPGRANLGVLHVAANLAARFDARVIGIAVSQPMQLDYGVGVYDGSMVQLDRDEVDRDMAAAEGEFRHALRDRNAVEWRSKVLFTSAAEYIAGEARSADILITGVTTGTFLNATPEMSTGDLVMEIGRPVLIVPASALEPKLDRVVLAWKDTRETRRAAMDALPLLRRASHVTVIELAAEDELIGAGARLRDVAGWLGRHGVVAEIEALHSTSADSTALDDFARAQRSDLVVAGAYGHNRVREWALGGVTRDLLLRTDRCSLLSH